MVTVVEFRLEYLQVPNLQPRGSERNLKVHGNGWTGPLLLIISGQQLDLSTDLRLLHSCHAFDLPHDGILTGLVFRFSFHTDHLHSTSVQRCGNTHLYFLCQERGFEVRFDDNFDLQLCAPNLSDQRNDPEGQDYVFSGAIPHELIIPVRRNETDAALRVELAETHTLIERAVVDGYGLFATATSDRETKMSV